MSEAIRIPLAAGQQKRFASLFADRAEAQKRINDAASILIAGALDVPMLPDGSSIDFEPDAIVVTLPAEKPPEAQAMSE